VVALAQSLSSVKAMAMTFILFHWPDLPAGYSVRLWAGRYFSD
jgi:hypothetical protein